MPGTGISNNDFWNGFNKNIHELASKNKELISADYSQIELRIMAHLSEDKGLVAAFNNNEDIHSLTASEVFSINQDAVTQDLRRSAKAINFGLIYGISAFGLCKQ